MFVIVVNLRLRGDLNHRGKRAYDTYTYDGILRLAG
jgi:hypothetical protein